MRRVRTGSTSGSRREPLEQSVQLLLVHRLVVRVVDHHRGRAVAPGDALDLDHRELAVPGRPLETDAEATAAVLDEPLRAGEVAGDGRADLQEVLPDGTQVVHRVEGQDAIHVRG